MAPAYHLPQGRLGTDETRSSSGPGTPGETRHSPEGPLRLLLVELGYGSDTNHEWKYHQKTQQHERLVALLREAGHDVSLQVVTLGTTGTLPTSLPTVLHNLGLTAEEGATLMQKLHKLATQAAAGITSCRRHLEHSSRAGG